MSGAPRYGKQQEQDCFDQPVRAEVIRTHQYRAPLPASRTMQEPGPFLRAYHAFSPNSFPVTAMTCGYLDRPARTGTRMLGLATQLRQTVKPRFRRNMRRRIT